MTRMIGPQCHKGPGGRDCSCCNVPPGRDRRIKRRTVKRGKRNTWRREIRSGKW